MNSRFEFSTPTFGGTYVTSEAIDLPMAALIALVVRPSRLGRHFWRALCGAVRLSERVL